MALEGRFYPHADGGDCFYPLTSVHPGEYTMIQDKSHDLAKLVVAHCFEQNTGGYVLVIDEDSIPFNGKSGTLGPEVFDNPEYLDAVIPPGGVYKRDIIDSTGEEGELVFYYTGLPGLTLN